MIASKRPLAPRGLTLVEVLIALGLAVVLLGTAFIFVNDLVRARERIERLSVRERSMDIFLDAVEQAIASCSLDAGDGGVVGDALHCSIWSASSDPGRLVRTGDSPFPASVSSEFGFEEGDGSLRIRRGDGPEEMLPAELVAARFRYHDGFEWVDEFDGAARRRLPAAIEVCFWTVPWPEGSRPSWMPESAPVEESTPAGDTSRDGSLEAFRPMPPADFDDDAAPASPAPGGRTSSAAAQRDGASAPAPERRRVILVPDSAPPSLMPSPGGGDR